MQISKTIRQDILDSISLEAGSWNGQLDDVTFLKRIFDLESMPSFDSRFSTASGDIYQHRINNNDWEDDWLYTDQRFNILGTDDRTFLHFLCEVLHPVVRPDTRQAQRLRATFNEHLRAAGYELIVRTKISNKPVYEARRLRGNIVREQLGHQIRFYTKSPLPNDVEYPCFILLSDKWNDYGYQTTYKANFLEKANHVKFSYDIKIYQKGQYLTKLPNQFGNLDNSFCSLGQSLKYYEALKDLGQDIYTKVLTSLNDVVFNPKIATEFESTEGFKKSLLRFSEAEKAYREAGSLFLGKTRSRNFKFNFTTKVPGAEDSHSVEFDFSPDQTELHRITAIIGKNGTGKTQVLANFATAMSGLSDTGEFDPFRPSFSRVIAIAYSVFDEFQKPIEGTETFSYKYCGVKTSSQSSSTTQEIDQGAERLLTPQEIRSKLGSALDIVFERNLEDKLVIILEALLKRTIQDSDLRSAKKEINRIFYESLSSGQRILVLIMAEVIAYITEESIILFDEPEIHLHPDALSALARAFHLLLDEFNSYAIVATHSPILLQEIPAKYVLVFDREGNFPIVTPLNIESFGENLTVITEDVFHTSEQRNNYRDHLEVLAEKYSYEEVLKIFGGQLGFNARAFLRTLYP